jgi:hypothetical protein
LIIQNDGAHNSDDIPFVTFLESHDKPHKTHGVLLAMKHTEPFPKKSFYYDYSFIVYSLFLLIPSDDKLTFIKDDDNDDFIQIYYKITRRRRFTGASSPGQIRDDPIRI